MKNTLIGLMLFLFTGTLNAQIVNNLSVELNIARYSQETGILYDRESYPNVFSFINGFNIGYNPSEKWQNYIGVRSLTPTINSVGGFSYETSVVKGVEIKFGTRFSPRSHKKVYLSYGLEVFGEFSNHLGTYSLDYPPIYEVNHKKSYFGIAPNLTIHVKLDERIALFADTRYRFGRVHATQREGTHPSIEQYPSREYWAGIFEPLNAVGLKFKF